MKTLLVGINAKYIHPNLAIRLLKANTDYECDLIEFNIKDNIDEIVNYIINNKYDVVGFSCYIWNINLINEILYKLKPYNLKIILGGPEVSYNHQYYFDNNLADFIIKNEGEEAFDLLLKYLDNKVLLKDIPNLYHKNGFTFNKLVDISKIKMAYHLLDDLKNKIVYVETSRGCPYHCGYCMASLDNKLRFFDIEEIKKSIKVLIDKGARIFKFLDRTFNAHKKNFINLIDFIIENHKDGNSFQFEITGDLLDDDIINYINNNAPKNLFRFEIGIQSTNIKSNEAVYRIQNNVKLFRNIRLIQDANIIDLHLDLIAGLPYEDYNSFKNTFNEVLSLRPKELQLGFLKLLHGTKLYFEKEKYGYIYNDKAPYEIIKNDFMNQDDIKNIHICEDAFDNYYNKGILRTSLNYILDNIPSGFDFFFDLGSMNSNSKRLEDRFKTIDELVKNKYNENYENFHELLIIDYLSCYKIKPTIWWDEKINKQDKNNLLRELVESNKLDVDLLTLYKYSQVIVLNNVILVVVYKDNQMNLYKIKKD